MKKIRLGRTLFTTFVSLLMIITSFSGNPTLIYADPPAPEATLTKTATQVPGKLNTWEMKLRVEVTPKTETTDVVLVLDRSGSMKDSVSGTGKTRMQLAKEAANQFIDSTMVGGVRIALVSYAGETVTESGFTTNAANLKSKVNALSADGGTFTQQGLKIGHELLATSTANHKILVLLSDGEPTYGYEPNYSYPADTGTVYTNAPNSTSEKVLSDNRETLFVASDFDYAGGRIGSGMASYSRINGNNGERRNYNFAKTAIAEAGIAKAKGQTIFSIALGAGAVGEYSLKGIASKPEYYFQDAGSTLQTAFAAIALQIKQPLVGSIKVTDPMGPGFSLVGGSVLLSADSTHTVSPANQINWTINKFQLDPTDSNKMFAEMKYQITTNANIVGMFDGLADGATPEFPTNGTTTFVYIPDDTTKPGINKEFTVPKVKPTVVRVDKELQNEQGVVITDDTLDFKFSLNTTGQTNNGQVKASGHTYIWQVDPVGLYTLTETEVLNGHLDEFEVSYTKGGQLDLAYGSGLHQIGIINKLKTMSFVPAKTVSDANGNGLAEPGETLNYTITVENTGNRIIRKLFIKDDLATLIPHIDGIAGVALDLGGTPALLTDLVAGIEVNIPVGETLTIKFSVKAKDDLDVDLVVLLSNIALIGTIEKDAKIPTGAPKLEASKSVSDANGNNVAEPGEFLNYTIKIKNTGKVGATDVFVQDTLSEIIGHVDDVSTTKIMVDGAERNLSELINGFDLDVGVDQTILITFSVKVKADLDPAITPKLANMATVGDLNPETEISTGTPKLVSSKTVKDRNENDYAEAGEFLDYEITLTNNGNLYKNNVTIKDTLVDLIPHIQNVGDLEFTLDGVVKPIQDLIDGFAVNVAAGQTIKIKFTVQVKDDLDTTVVKTLRNRATVGDDTPGTDIPTGAPKLAIDKIVVDANENGFAEAGEVLFYEIWVSNSGEVTARDVFIKDDLALMFAHLGDISGEQFEIDGDFYPLNDLRNGITMDVDVGEANTLKIKFKVTVKAMLNTTTVTKIDNRATANGIPAETTIPTGAPKLTADKSVSDANQDGFAEAGEALTYSITVKNDGEVAKTGLFIQDTLSDLLPYIDDISTINYIMGSETDTLQRLIDGFTITLGVGETVTLTFTVIVKDGLNTNEVKMLRNLATVGDDTPETEIPTGAPKLTSVKTVMDENEDGIAEAGELLYYEITITNSGNVMARNVQIQDTLADLLAHVDSLDDVNLEIGETSQSIQNLIDGLEMDIMAGSEIVLRFTLRVKDDLDTDAITVLRNIATVNDETPETEIPTGAPKLAAEKFVYDENDDGFAEPGELLDYEIKITNSGNVAKKDLLIKDTLENLLGHVDDMGSVTFTIGTETRPLQDLMDGFMIDIDAETIITLRFTLRVKDDLNVNEITVLHNLAVVGDDTPEVEIPTGAPKLTSGKVVKDQNENGFAEAGETLFYEIWMTNSGNVKTKEIMVKDDLKDLLAYIDSPMGGSFTLNGIEHPMADLMNGKMLVVDAETTIRIRFSVTVKADMVIKDIAILRNIAMVGDETPETEIPTGEPKLSSIKIARDDNEDGFAQASELMHYTIMVMNQGNVSAKDVLIKDDLALLKDHIEDLGGVMFDMDGELYPIETLMNGFMIDIAPEKIVKITFTVKVKADIDVKVVTVLNNEAFVNEVPITTETPTEKPNLDVEKEVIDQNGDGMVFPNGTLTYSIMIKNNAQSNAYNVKVTDKLNNILYAIKDPSDVTLYKVYKGITTQLKVKNLMEGMLVDIDAGETLILYFAVVVKGDLLEKDILVNLVEVDNLTATATIDLDIPLVEPEKIPKPAEPIKVKPTLPATGVNNRTTQNGIQLIAMGIVLMSLEAMRKRRQKAE